MTPEQREKFEALVEEHHVRAIHFGVYGHKVGLDKLLDEIERYAEQRVFRAGRIGRGTAEALEEFLAAREREEREE